MSRKGIVLFVEGQGEAAAAPRLVKKLLTAMNAWDAVSLDENPFRVGQVHKLLKDDFREWKRKLAAASKRSNLGGVLLVLDGDFDRIGTSRTGIEEFCAAKVASQLAVAAKDVGAEATFSVAIVIARQEFESWLIAGFESFATKSFPDGRSFREDMEVPATDLETSPRNAKGWLNKVIDGGYKQTRDQAVLAEWLDPALVRPKMRSFRRLESAVSQLVHAIRNGEHMISPTDSGQPYHRDGL